MSEDSRKKFFSGAIVDAGMQKDFEIFSLLAKNKSKQSDKNKALFLTGLYGLFQGKQRKLQQRLLDNLKDLDKTFQTEQESRRTIYNKENENRNFYDTYKANPSQGIEDYAKFLYNNDEAISQSAVNYGNKGFYKGETGALVDDLWQSKLEEAERDLEQMGKNPLITSRTFQEYDKVYYDTYKAEKRQYKDDPTQSSLVASAANTVFPSWFDNRKADLQLAVEEGNTAINTQEENEKFGSLAAADYLAAQPKFDKKQAIKQITDAYGDMLSYGELEIVTRRINSKPENQVFTDDELISLTVSTRILNPNNQSPVRKKIEETKEFHKEKYLYDNNLTSLPARGTDEYAIYKQSQNDYVNLNVFSTDPQVVKDAKQLIAIINNESIDKGIRKIAQAQYNNLGIDKTQSALIVDVIRNYMDSENDGTMQDLIDKEKEELEKNSNYIPKYLNDIEYLQYNIKRALELHKIGTELPIIE